VELLLDAPESAAFAKGYIMAANPTAVYNGEAIGANCNWAGPDSVVVNRVEVFSSGTGRAAAAKAKMWFAGPQWAAGAKFTAAPVKKELKANGGVRVPRANVKLA
jgi:hypothetical protein